MDDALLVRRLQRFSDLFRDQQCLAERDRSMRDPLRKILAVDELHHEGLDAVAVFQSVDCRNVRMIQGGEDFGLTLKPCEPIVVAGNRERQIRSPDTPNPSRLRRSAR